MSRASCRVESSIGAAPSELTSRSADALAKRKFMFDFTSLSPSLQTFAPDVPAIVHAIEVDLAGFVIGIADRQVERRTARRHAQHAAARSCKNVSDAFCSGVKHGRFVDLIQSRDRVAGPHLSRIAGRRQHYTYRWIH